MKLVTNTENLFASGAYEFGFAIKRVPIVGQRYPDLQVSFSLLGLKIDFLIDME